LIELWKRGGGLWWIAVYSGRLISIEGRGSRIYFCDNRVKYYHTALHIICISLQALQRLDINTNVYIYIHINIDVQIIVVRIIIMYAHDRLEPRSRIRARTMVIITTRLRILFWYLHEYHRRKGYTCLLVFGFFLFFIQRRRTRRNVVARDNNRVPVACVYLGHRLSAAAVASPHGYSP